MGYLTKKNDDAPLSSYRFWNDPFYTFSPLAKQNFTVSRTTSMKMDIRENENEYVFEAELPGVQNKDLSISVDGDYMIIEAKKIESKEEKNDIIYYKEIKRGSYKEKIIFPKNTSRDIDATYENGILTISVPKIKEQNIDQKSIPINFK